MGHQLGKVNNELSDPFFAAGPRRLCEFTFSALSFVNLENTDAGLTASAEALDRVVEEERVAKVGRVVVSE
jgi:hypothetical protein